MEYSGFKNLTTIYNSQQITLSEKIILIVLFIIHWIIIITMASYLVWGKKQYDWIFGFYFLFLFVTWYIVYGECLISYYEKRMIFDKKVLTFDEKYMKNPSISFYCKNNLFTILLFTLINIIYVITGYIILQRHHIPRLYITILIILGIYSILNHRGKEIIDLYNSN
jgi:hypothetical protein